MRTQTATSTVATTDRRTTENTYTPRITYRHPGMAREIDPWSVPVVTTRTLALLPYGYANYSARTRLSRKV